MIGPIRSIIGDRFKQSYFWTAILVAFVGPSISNTPESLSLPLVPTPAVFHETVLLKIVRFFVIEIKFNLL